MRRVIVTAGPQGCGKTTYCRKLLLLNPALTLVSRDEILNELYGTVWLSPYTGQHEYGEEMMWERVVDHLQGDEAFLILDTWNGSDRERGKITERLRKLGADRVIGYRFTTPERIALQWYIQRESVGKDPKYIRQLTALYRVESYHHDYQLFHSFGVTRDQGFDAVLNVNPLQGDLWLAV